MVEVVEVHEPFGAIFADPPWGYANFVHAKHGAAAAHYDELDTESLKRIPVAEWAAKKSFLFLWATWPKLPIALEVMDAWDFDYVTGVPWIKTVPSKGTIQTGVGHWTQGTSEMLLIGRRKKSGATRKKKRGPPVKGLLVGEGLQFYAPRAAHSKKPEELQSWIERVVKGPYLEMFATRARDGWTTWGLATGYNLSPRGVERLQPESRPFGAHGRRAS